MSIALFFDAFEIGAKLLEVAVRLAWNFVSHVLVYHPAGRVLKVILDGTYTNWAGVVDIAGAAYDSYEAIYS